MNRYFYQINDKELEVILETDEGFEWICDCGHLGDDKSEEKAKLITSLLNVNIGIEEEDD